MPTIHIETDRLLLRNIVEEDAEGLFELDADPLVHRYLGNHPFECSFPFVLHHF